MKPSLSSACAAPVGLSGDASISILGVPTCNRPEMLRHCLTSYIQNHQQHGRESVYVVADDSTHPGVRTEYKRITNAIAATCNVTVVYFGLEDKLLLAQKLIAGGVAPADVIKFALFDSERTGLPTHGANRNALLLKTAGEAVLMVDDDTLCRQAAPPLRQDAVQLAEELPFTPTHPYSAWMFPNSSAMMESLRFEDREIFASHEALLGKAPCHAEAADGHHRNGAAVRVTVGGVAGDCGWAAPWHWAFVGESLERLTASEETYRTHSASRTLLRVVTQPTITNRTRNSLGLFTALDHRRLLPPFMPVGRGEDTIFWATLARTLPRALIGYVPSAVLHLPSEKRAFWPGEMKGSASGIPLDQLFSVLIDTCAVTFDPADETGNLRKLGDAFQDLGRLQPGDFAERALAGIRSMVASYGLVMQRRLAELADRRPFWAADVRAYLEALDAASGREDFWVPLDVRYGRSVAEAAALTQKLVCGFGRLAHYWPEISQAAFSARARAPLGCS